MSNPKKKAFREGGGVPVSQYVIPNILCFFEKETEGKSDDLSVPKDRKLAERRLKEFRGDADKLSRTGRNKMTFRELGKLWEPIATANLKQSSSDRVKRCLRTLNAVFGDRIDILHKRSGLRGMGRRPR